jgi:Mo25-like
MLLCMLIFNMIALLLQVNAYDNADIALLCGSMLRECVRYESLARATLNDEALWKFFDVYVHLPNFDVASDAFATLRDLLTRNKGVASEFLSERCVSETCLYIQSVLCALPYFASYTALVHTAHEDALWQADHAVVIALCAMQCGCSIPI